MGYPWYSENIRKVGTHQMVGATLEENCNTHETRWRFDFIIPGKGGKKSVSGTDPEVIEKKAREYFGVKFAGLAPDFHNVCSQVWGAKEKPVEENKTGLADGRIYRNVYFRVETPNYLSNNAKEVESVRAFYAEIVMILSNMGFTTYLGKHHMVNDVPMMRRGVETLYCHPQDVSGYVTESSVAEIEQALKNGQSFLFRKTDIFEEAHNFTKEEFQRAFAEKEPEIEQQLLTNFITKRSNLYRYLDAMGGVGSGLKYFHGTNFMGVPTFEHHDVYLVHQVFNRLVEQGKIVKATKGTETVYRTVVSETPKKKKAASVPEGQLSLF